MKRDDLIRQHLNDHLVLFSRLDTLVDVIAEAGLWMEETIRSGKKILVCGNGGSASDAEHLAAELVGRFGVERVAWPAIALTTNTSALTAIGNDYAFNRIFARQIEALAKQGDLLLGISTSGKSENVLHAVDLARSKGTRTIGLLGADGGDVGRAVDLAVIIPDRETARIQETHIFILHVWCAMLESILVRPDQPPVISQPDAKLEDLH